MNEITGVIYVYESHTIINFNYGIKKFYITHKIIIRLYPSHHNFKLNYR